MINMYMYKQMNRAMTVEFSPDLELCQCNDSKFYIFTNNANNENSYFQINFSFKNKIKLFSRFHNFAWCDTLAWVKGFVRSALFISNKLM